MKDNEKKYYINLILEKEKKRNENMRLAYEKKLLELPKGSLFIRNLNGREYCYLRYREGKKVIQKYAGTMGQKEFLTNQIEERKHLEKLIEMLKEEQKIIEKMEMIK